MNATTSLTARFFAMLLHNTSPFGSDMNCTSELHIRHWILTLRPLSSHSRFELSRPLRPDCNKESALSRTVWLPLQQVYPQGNTFDHFQCIWQVLVLKVNGYRCIRPSRYHSSKPHFSPCQEQAHLLQSLFYKSQHRYKKQS